MDLSSELIQLISVIELFAAALLSTFLAIKTFHKYKEQKDHSTLYISLNFFLTGIGLASIAIDRILLTTLLDTTPGLIFHNIAIYSSLAIIMFLDLFSFEMTYPDKIKILAIIMFVLFLISGCLLAIYQPKIDVFDFNKEVIYPDQLLFIIAPFIFPPIIVPIVVFLYFAVRVRKESKPKSLRALTMGIASVIVAIAYIFELMGVSGLIAIIIRLIFVIYVLLMYISFTLPSWYQKAIGWN